MEISTEIQDYIDRSVLCWLATSSAENIPNVSPKEIFTSYQSDKIIVANIASPQTVKNVKENPSVCLSFVDILVQKGYQLKGRAQIIESSDDEFAVMAESLERMTEGKFPFAAITCITVETAKPILAPRYLLYPQTTEEEQIENAKRTYLFSP